MAIIINNDGTIDPFDITLSRETRMSLMAATRDMTEEKDVADGDIDFGTELKTGEFTIRGIIEFDTVAERYAALRTLAGQLNACLTKQQLTFESDPDKYIYVKLSGKPEIVEYPTWLDITITFKIDTYWESISQHSLTGSGLINNAGTFEIPLLIEIPGPATSPFVSVGASVLLYASAVAAGKTLIIDTGNQTAYISSVIPLNAMGKMSGGFPLVSAAASVSVVPSISTAIVRWRDRYI